MPTLAHDLRFSSFCSLFFIREEKNTGNEKVCKKKKKKKNEVILIGSFLNL